jgi:hypothetical protein
MKRLSLIHRFVAAGNIAAAFAGFSGSRSVSVTLNLILLVVVVVLIRAKFWIDDEQYFEDVESGKLAGGLAFRVGLGFASVSWLVWYFAAYSINDVELASLLMAIAIGVSTLWIIATIVPSGAYAEQVPWLFFNTLFIAGFLLIRLRHGSWNPFADHAEGFTTGVIIGLLVVFLFDFGVTRVLEQRRTAKA